MAGKSLYAKKATLNTLIGAGAYVALYKNNPGEDDTGDEVTGYTRLKTTFSAPLKEKGLTLCANSDLIDYAARNGGYGTITHIGLRDAATGGNLLYYAELPRSIKSVDDTRPVRFEPGELKVVED